MTGRGERFPPPPTAPQGQKGGRMPQHPDSYELNPHWNMGGEFAFRGEVIPHPTHLIRLGAEPQPEPQTEEIREG